MKARWLLVITVVAAFGLQGCTAGHKFVNKPWGKGTWIPAVICAAAGAGAGIGIQEATLGSSTVTFRNADGSIATDSSGKPLTLEEEDTNDYWQGALIGAAVGSVLCGLAGHYFFDPDEEAPPPPPPPPPPPNPEGLPPPSSQRLVLRGVNFDFDKSDIRPDSRPVLDEGADGLTTHPHVRISVEGHTDAVGSDAYNEKLSVRRAEAVFRYLVNRGVLPERMEVIGYGESRPVADNETDEGRAQNRRVELHVVRTGEEDNAPGPAPVPVPVQPLPTPED